MCRTRVDKVNAELVTLTYGTIVAQLCSDFDNNYGEVNKQLDRMGYNIGMRLVEDFFAKSGVQRCATLRDTAETIAKVRGVTSVSLDSFHLDHRASRWPCMPTLLHDQTECLADRLQNVSKHHSYRYELVKRQ